MYHIQASAPASSSSTESGYWVKLFIIITFSLGSLISFDSSRRDSTTASVIAGFLRHCAKISPPMKPVLPVRMIFIIKRCC